MRIQLLLIVSVSSLLAGPDSQVLLGGAVKRVPVTASRVVVEAHKGDLICLEKSDQVIAKLSLKRVPWFLKKVKRQQNGCTLAGPFEAKRTGRYEFTFNVEPVVFD